MIKASKRFGRFRGRAACSIPKTRDKLWRNSRRDIRNEVVLSAMISGSR